MTPSWSQEFTVNTVQVPFISGIGTMEDLMKKRRDSIYNVGSELSVISIGISEIMASGVDISQEKTRGSKFN